MRTEKTFFSIIFAQEANEKSKQAKMFVQRGKLLFAKKQ